MQANMFTMRLLRPKPGSRLQDWMATQTHRDAGDKRNVCDFRESNAFPNLIVRSPVTALSVLWHISSSVLFAQFVLDCVRNVVAHGDAREGKWRGNWRMEWVASTLTRPRNVVYPTLLTLMRTPWLPAVDWTDSPADLNGLVRFGERRNVVSACVPSGSARTLPFQQRK